MPTCIEQIYNFNIDITKPVVFLDRDGTIIKNIPYLHRVEDIAFLPQTLKALQLLQKKGVSLIIITNQPVVAKGLLTIKKLKEMHNILVKQLKENDITIHAIYSCPHHPNATLTEYRVSCVCRKPGIGMLKKAVKKFKIDITRTGIIGDSFRDIEAGKNFGIPSYFISNENDLNSFPTLLEATQAFLQYI